MGIESTCRLSELEESTIFLNNVIVDQSIHIMTNHAILCYFGQEYMMVVMTMPTQ